MSQPINGKNQHRREPEILRRRKDEHRTFGNKLQFLDLQRKVGLLFGLFARRYLFAQFTGMRTVESLGDGFTHGLGLEILRKHVRPRHGLKHGPMPTCRAQQRNHQQAMTESFQHCATLNSASEEVKNCASGQTIKSAFRSFLHP